MSSAAARGAGAGLALRARGAKLSVQKMMDAITSVGGYAIDETSE
jgi:hypothetical protein